MNVPKMPISGTPVYDDNPYGTPSAYFPRSIFPDYEGGSVRSRQGDLAPPTAASAMSLSSSGQPHNRTRPLDDVDDRDPEEAMRNPDVAAAFRAAAAGGVSGAVGNGAASNALGRRRDQRPHDDGRATRRAVSSFEVVEASDSTTGSYVSSRATSDTSGSDAGESLPGIPLDPAQYRHRRHRTRRRRLVQLGAVGSPNSGGISAAPHGPSSHGNGGGDDDSIQIVTLRHPQLPLPATPGSSRSSSRSSTTRGGHQRHRGTSHLNPENSTTGSTNAMSDSGSSRLHTKREVDAEMARRRGETHDAGCICTLCQERRLQQEPNKKSAKLQERYVENKTCVYGVFCSVM